MMNYWRTSIKLHWPCLSTLSLWFVLSAGVLHAEENAGPFDGSPESQVALTDRRMTQSVLKSIFGEKVTALPGQEMTQLDDAVIFGLRRTDGFGRPAGEPRPSSGSVREGYRIRACLRIDSSWGLIAGKPDAAEQLIDRPRLKKALFGANTAWIDPTKATIRIAYGFFNPGSVASEPMVEFLMSRSKLKMGTVEPTTEQKWQNIFLALCLDPSWQVL